MPGSSGACRAWLDESPPGGFTHQRRVQAPSVSSVTPVIGGTTRRVRGGYQTDQLRIVLSGWQAAKTSPESVAHIW